MGKENQDENRIIYVAVNSTSSNQGTVTTTTSSTTTSSNQGTVTTTTSSTTSTLSAGEYTTFFLIFRKKL
jgi:hypothetical protein